MDGYVQPVVPCVLEFRTWFLALLKSRFSRTLKAMEVHFAPELQAKIDRLVIETGRAPDKMVEDAMAGYVAELEETREMLNSRYDDLKSGRVKPISRDEVIARFREKSAARRTPPIS
jgi:predicted transcriptional regulator